MGGEKYETINIFSLASGHLYERFLRIMMLSVLKNTKHNVKFWLLNNYLSPQFRVCPHDKLGKHFVTQNFAGNFACFSKTLRVRLSID
jgi:hypothetical protein